MFVFSLGDPSIDWEESVYLNLILHQVSESHMYSVFYAQRIIIIIM